MLKCFKVRIMIKKFEKETKPLTDWEEKTLLPIMVKELSKHRSSRNAIKSDILSHKVEEACGQRPNSARIRKVVNHIRICGLLPCLVATSDGYFIATSHNEIADCVISLRQRARQIDTVASALDTQMRKYFPLDSQLKLDFENKEVIWN